ncbi:T9SS type A sorting domain-containing protein [Pricia sp.]|uniref:T9SS type A sorting domain-containing protein n=1 Tax=Pricia sp. TaxID=2268138 RepID=UPI003593CA8F
MASKTLVYPNPINRGNLTVYLGEGDWGTVEVSLYAANGTNMLKRSQEVLNSEIQFNVDALSKGMYMLAITAKDAQLHYKIIRK